MVAFTILAGGYDVFVATYIFNSSCSSLSLPVKLTGDNVNSAVNEVSAGALQSFAINPTGALSPAIDTVSSGGDGPAFATALSTDAVAIFNYNSGNGRIIATNPTDATAFRDTAPVISFPQPTPPNVSHPHMALQHETEVLVPDLGGDKIWRLAPISGNYEIQGFVPQPEDNRLFTLHELASTLTVQRIPSEPNGTAPIIASASIIPPDPPAGAAFAAGEILIPKPTREFSVPYIYVSNRNTGVQDPRGDAIAIFEHVYADTPKEGLRLVRHVYTGLDQPRGMEFGPEDGRGGEAFLAVAGVAGNGGVKIFKRTEGGKNLELVATNLEIPTRSTFVWL
ncbi:hypothetical protein C0995_012510 [Termitomyces sp. Mi166|nr:hypothetical protein C0995_012510 [Termitomyces sp. Mi166\